MASQITPLSASVTRILYLYDFPSELKTRDIQAAFSDWENVNGGFKIKWKDDTSLLIVFADALTAKRAYLQTLASPPAVFSSPTSSKTASIKPYDGADAQAIIQAVNARAHSHNGSRSHRSSVSINGFPNNSRKSQLSMSTSIGSLAGMAGIPEASPITMTGTPTAISPLNTIARDHSPTLPNVPAHPTLTSLINLSLPINAESDDGFVSAQPPTVANDHPSGLSSETHSTPPRIGDPGRRMVGHALGIRHPSLNNSRSPSASVTVEQVQQNLAGLTVQE